MFPYANNEKCKKEFKKIILFIITLKKTLIMNKLNDGGERLVQ